VVPAFYAVWARNTRSPHHVSRAIARLRSAPAVATTVAGGRD